MTQPSLFVSHGAPDIVLGKDDAGRFLAEFGKDFSADKKPDAIVVASAHFETGEPAVVADPAPGMIYDFGGFQPELYEMVYPAPGDEALAHDVVSRLATAGISAQSIGQRGYDHGSWTVLKLMFPAADVPVVQVAIQPEKDAEHHLRLGRALSGLRRDNVMVIGSGHITHNLQAVFAAMRGGVVDQEMGRRTRAFTGWVAEQLESGDTDALINWQDEAPFALDNHPTPEHFMPLFFALGAGGDVTQAKRLHTSMRFGLFQSDVWAFSQS